MTMEGWKISLEGVQGVLTKLDTAATTLSSSMDGVTTAHEELVAGAGFLVGAPNVLIDFLTDEQGNLTKIGNRITGCANGVTYASLAFKAGDEEMAETAQKAGADAADTGIFDYFTTVELPK